MSRQTSERICDARFSETSFNHFSSACIPANDAANENFVIIIERKQRTVWICRHRTDECRNKFSGALRADHVERFDDPPMQWTAVTRVERRVIAVPADV